MMDHVFTILQQFKSFEIDIWSCGSKVYEQSLLKLTGSNKGDLKKFQVISDDSRLVSEQFSQAPQKLAFYNWYGSARLFHFRVPPDTVLLHWLLQVTRGSGPTCNNVETTV